MFGAPFDGMQVLLPGGWAPQLEVVVVAGHYYFALEAGMAGEGGRDEHPALSVQVGLGRPREEERPQLARLARERVERGDAVLDAHLPGLPRVHRDVAVEPAREHDPGTQRVAEAARQRDPALLVDRVVVGADEHRPRMWPIPFVISTIPHSTPLSPTVNPYDSIATNSTRCQTDQGSQRGDGMRSRSGWVRAKPLVRGAGVLALL